MKLSDISPPRDRGHDDEVRDLVSLGDFLAPEMHRVGGIDEAASAVREWADDDLAMIDEAETIASNIGTIRRRSCIGRSCWPR
jgi:hypothetical protein